MSLPRIKQLKVLFLIFITVSLSLSCSNSKTLKCKSVVDGDIIILNCDFLAPYYIDKTTVVHHGINEDAMRIWCKKIDERNRAFIKRFILDYL